MHRTITPTLMTGLLVAGIVALAPAALAEAQHSSTMSANATLQNQTQQYISPSQAPYSGEFVVKSGRGVTMSCWTTGAQADGQGKWFMVTVTSSGTGYGQTGYVPASRVAHQWMSSPRCS